MNEPNVTPLRENTLSTEQAEAVGGGADACTIVQAISDGARASVTTYEALVDFTSHVIERLVNSSK